MKTKTNNLKGYYIAFLASCVVLLICSAIWDLKIDRFINGPENPFGKFFERTGELPVYLVMPFSAMVLFATRKRDGNLLSTLKMVLIVVYSLFGCIVLSTQFGGYWFIKDDFKDIYTYIFGIIFCPVTLLIAKHIPLDIMKKLRPFAFFIMIAGIGTTLTVELMKNLWGRVRFRDLLKDDNDFARFTAWYLPQWNGDNKSFPSGHTGAAAASMLLSALPAVFEQLKKYEVRIFICSVIYTFAVGLSRMVLGAHFLSDITVGALVGFAWYFCVRKFYLEKKIG